MSRLAPGTPVVGPYASYTAEQLVALEAMKDRSYTLGVARAEFVNTILRPDGSRSADILEMIAATEEKLTAILAGGSRKPDALAAAKVAADKIEEVVRHVEQGRFLFVVDADCVPVVYFQVAVDHNPDLPAELPDDREALEERAWEIAEVQEHVAAVAAAGRTAAARKASTATEG